MKSATSKPTTHKHKKMQRLIKHQALSPYCRRFRYTGNIAHIKSYIETNRKGADCMVEIFVRPLTREERELWGLSKNEHIAKVA